MEDHLAKDVKTTTAGRCEVWRLKPAHGPIRHLSEENRCETVSIPKSASEAPSSASTPSKLPHHATGETPNDTPNASKRRPRQERAKSREETVNLLCRCGSHRSSPVVEGRPEQWIIGFHRCFKKGTPDTSLYMI